MKPRFLVLPVAARAALPLVLCLAASSFAVAVTGSWNTDAAGTWSTASSWTGGVPNGIGDGANFTNNITAARTISLAGNRTVGALNIGDSGTSYFGFTINAGTPGTSQLVFDQTGTANATITVPNTGGVATNTITPFSVLLKDNLVVTTAFPNSGTTQLSINGIITDGSGSCSLTKEGPGIVVLQAPNNYKGGTLINAGRLNAQSSVTAFGAGPVTVASGGQAYLNTSGTYNNFTIAGTGYANSADTAAQAGAIRLENNRGVMGNVTITAAGARLGVNTSAAGFIGGNLLGTGNLEIHSPVTTTGTVSLLGSASGYSGTLSMARGNFNFAGAFGGSMSVVTATGATTTLGGGTSVAGGLTLDSTNAVITYRNNHGTLAIGGALNLGGSTTVSPSSFPAPGTGTLTLMTYASKTGAGTLAFNATGYRGTPAISVGATSAAITGLDGQTRTWVNALANGMWDLNASANWDGGDNKFCHADAVVFSDVAAGTVTLTGTVVPHSITFTNTTGNDYVLTGGVIDGAGGGITKSGAGIVTLGGTNTFVGPVAVNAGRLSLGTAQALGFTTGVTVASGASLDLNGKGMTAVSRMVDITISGSGDGNLPALANNGANIAFTGSAAAGIRNVTLAADATIGGTGNFDIGSSGILDGGGFTLTKTGTSQVYLTGLSRNLNTVVEGGTLSGYGPDPFGTTLRIKAGGIAQAANPGTYTSQVTIESGGVLQHAIGTESLWTGAFTVPGDAELSCNNTTGTSLTVVQGFSVPGNLTKSGGGTVTLYSDVPVSGGVSVTGGILLLGTGGGTGSFGSAPVTLSAGATLNLFRSGTVAFGSAINGAGNFQVTGPAAVSLPATSTYAGSTTVSAGSLQLLNPAHSGGTLTTSAGTWFGAAGTFGNTGVSGILSPGTLSAPIATLNVVGTGAATVMNLNLGATATYEAQINTDNGTADKIAVSGTGTAAGNVAIGAGTTLSLANLGTTIAAPGTKFTLMTYTGTITGSFAGLPEGGVVGIGGTNYVIRYADGGKNLTLTVATAYDNWILGYYAGSSGGVVLGATADPDKDGVANLMEYVLGSNPSSSLATHMPVGVRSGSDFLFSFDFRKEAEEAGYMPAVEYSSTMAPGEWFVAGPETYSSVDHGSYRTFTITPPYGSLEKLFGRLRVTAP
ncbi:autotransporter-associated beta strand repeat-containing protein [Luteolibacter ambystomatis]|uniref:Autotransporter-associated beta strand repeat-containing protein n=1 Tax=Luteolibacter ambystomatis TaxID=2824561 RepID=A0A975G7G2_9BACT|nr:autotransporter-associated beta strand repeat-containing protein [Luteolibacter ambystomatis]QUE50484.1 autotransporter-associated beta strand repeat-containing protein [Luteolibacter ambystomatis]